MKISILYLDDDAACLKLFQETFGREYDVRVATTCGEARRLLSERRAEIVVSDQVMPEMSGTDFLREVAGAYPESFRVLLTGGVTVGGVMREVGAGTVQLFIAKPWEAHEMREALRRAGLSFYTAG